MEPGNLFPPGYAVSRSDSHPLPFYCDSKRQVNNYIPGKEINNLHLFSGAPLDTGRKPTKTQKKRNQILPGYQVWRGQLGPWFKEVKNKTFRCQLFPFKCTDSLYNPRRNMKAVVSVHPESKLLKPRTEQDKRKAEEPGKTSINLGRLLPFPCSKSPDNHLLRADIS